MQDVWLFAQIDLWSLWLQLLHFYFSTYTIAKLEQCRHTLPMKIPNILHLKNSLNSLDIGRSF